MSTTIILGPPGTGKTTYLINLLGHSLVSGIQPRDIGFLTFSKAAALEAKQRAIAKFSAYDPKEFRYFRTLHSMAYYLCGINRSQVMGYKNLKELAELLCLDLSMTNPEDGYWGMSQDDRYFHLANLARIKMQPLKELWEETDDGELDYKELERIYVGINNYKKQRQVIDFTDMLEKANDIKWYPSFKILCIDEAQDLSRLQWSFAKKLIERADQTFIAGDDDQAIHTWAGADLKTFLEIKGHTKVLDQSYRIPQSVHDISVDVIEQITNRHPKPFKPRSTPGLVEYHTSIDDIDLSQGQWLLLARNGYILKDLKQLCINEGYPYSFKGESPLEDDQLVAIMAWEKYRKNIPLNQYEEDAIKKHSSKNNKRKAKEYPWYDALDKLGEDVIEYLRALKRRGESLTEEPRIRISTIHGAKGLEADNVLLLTEMSSRTFSEYEKCPDNENRVFYVGLTRTRENLYILDPSHNTRFNIPEVIRNPS